MSETGEKVIAKVRELVVANPDFIYESPLGEGSCVNVYEGKGSCLIGQALFDLGIIDASIETDRVNGSGIYSVIRKFELDISEPEANWLATVQSCQDCGLAWADAISHAEQENLL